MLRWRRIEISGGFLLLWAALYYLDSQGVVPWAALAALLHELGHYAALRCFGGRAALVRLTCAGAEMVISARRPLPLAGRLCTALAGPGTNLLLAALSARLAGVLGETAYLFAGLNLALAVFNLLPVEPLDGGQILGVLLAAALPEDRARRAAKALSLGLSLLLTAAGAALVLQGGSFTLLLAALWLLSACMGAAAGRRPGKKRKKRNFCLHSG